MFLLCPEAGVNSGAADSFRTAGFPSAGLPIAIRCDGADYGKRYLCLPGIPNSFQEEKSMNKTRAKRMLAFSLVAVMLLGVLPFMSYAADATNTASFSRSLEEVKELLGTDSYNEYQAKHADEPYATSTGEVDGTVYDSETTTATVKTENFEGRTALYIPETDKVSWKISIPSDGKYSLKIEYYPVEGKATSIERSLYIDGKVPFDEARSLKMTKVWSDRYPGEFGVFATDITGNDIRTTKVESPEWRTYIAADSTGFIVEPFEFYLTKGEHLITLEAVREPVGIGKISFIPVAVLPTYEEYLAAAQSAGYKQVSLAEPIKINAENPTNTSEQVIYPIYDRSSPITEPQDASRIKLNTIGSDKWETVGQWIRYTVTVPEDGLYNIAVRYRQEILTGMYVSRQVRINGEVPFKEASYLRFLYNDAWQSCALNDGYHEGFEFLLKAGENTIEFEVNLGEMADILSRISESLAILNDAYLKILMITGASPDAYRDYNFGRLIPETIMAMADEAEVIREIASNLAEINKGRGANVATLDTVANLVERMAGDEDEVAKNLGNLKSYLGTLGTWIYTAQKQSLELDYITVQQVGSPLPRAKASWYQAVWYEIKSFAASFYSDYNTIGATSEVQSDEAVTMWYTAGRDQAQILRQLIDYEFTPDSNVVVELKLVAGGSLLPSILAGVGPDVTFLASADTINYAIRSAVLPLNDYEGFDEVTARFSPAAMIPLTLYGTTYGIPSQLSFNMMFYRMDVFAELEIELPNTWSDMFNILPILQNNKMEIAFPSSLGGTIFALYQMGGELYADDGMRINLDSNLALTAFSNICDLFTAYRFPVAYDFPTRFRTGEMPLGIVDYTTYNTLIVYASELANVWEMVPVLGWEMEDGTVNHISPAGVSAIVMPRGAKNLESSWKLISWFTDAKPQAQYANELVAVMGPAAKYNTANMEALAELPWTASEYKALQAQMQHLAAVPEYPGGYIIARYVDFAFMDAYNNNADPVESMLDNITEINKELSRKRKEFGLDYYEISYSTSFVENADGEIADLSLAETAVEAE